MNFITTRSTLFRNVWRSACVVPLFALLLAAGCTSNSKTASSIKVEMTTNPAPPVVGLSDIHVKLTDSQGQPVAAAKVKLEGNMNHAGMVPSFAELAEKSPGVYEGKLDFTMAGAWFVVVTATVGDREEVTHKVDIPEVRAK